MSQKLASVEGIKFRDCLKHLPLLLRATEEPGPHCSKPDFPVPDSLVAGLHHFIRGGGHGHS